MITKKYKPIIAKYTGTNISLKYDLGSSLSPLDMWVCETTGGKYVIGMKGVKCSRSLFSFLHEIGHIRQRSVKSCRWPAERVLKAEYKAWEFAFKECKKLKITINKQMIQWAELCYKSYTRDCPQGYEMPTLKALYE